VCSLLVAGPASADEPGTAVLRVAHLSPDSPAVDVALAPVTGEAPLTDPGDDLTQGLTYGDVSAFTGLAPGSYAVSIRAAGTSRAEPPALSARVDIPAGSARTVAITGLFADLALQTLSDDLAPPPTGSARVRVLTAADVPPVDVSLASGLPLASSLAFPGAAAAVTVPAGATGIVVDGGPDLRAELPIEFTAGSVVSLLVLDAPDGGLTVRVVLDAAGPARTPTGAVEAGSGPLPPGPMGWAVAAVAAVAGLAATGRRSRTLLVLAATGLSLATAPSPTPAPVDAPLRPVALIAEGRVPPAAPVRLRIPAVGVDTPLTATGLDGAGALVPPIDGAGWYREGPAPGDVGPAVLTGHVDGGGAPAVFYRLRDLTPGDHVLVERADGSTVRFVVTAVARYAKDAFPTGTVYGPTPGAELRLITCGGTFDRFRGSYRDNVVVSARLG
jgi:hypothetical protein